MKIPIESNNVFVKLEPYEMIGAKKRLLETKKEIIKMLMTMGKFKNEISDESRKLGMLKNDARVLFNKVGEVMQKLPKKEHQESHVRLEGKRKLKEKKVTKMDMLESELEEIKRKLEKF